jgi:hypothetical protein
VLRGKTGIINRDDWLNIGQIPPTPATTPFQITSPNVENIKPPIGGENPYIVDEVTRELTDNPEYEEELNKIIEERNRDTLFDERMQAKRAEEWKLLKEAYNIQGDTWDSAIGFDTVSNQNLQKFKDRWEEILEEQDYSTYEFYSNYGGFGELGYDTDYEDMYNLLSNPTLSNKSGYLGGLI